MDQSGVDQSSFDESVKDESRVSSSDADVSGDESSIRLHCSASVSGTPHCESFNDSTVAFEQYDEINSSTSSFDLSSGSLDKTMFASDDTVNISLGSAALLATGSVASLHDEQSEENYEDNDFTFDNGADVSEK